MQGTAWKMRTTLEMGSRRTKDHGRILGATASQASVSQRGSSARNWLENVSKYVTGQSLSRFLFHLLQTPTGKPVLRKSCLLHDSACDCYVFGNRRFQHMFFFSRCGAMQVCFVWVDVGWVYISSKKWRCHCCLKFWVRQLSFCWRLGDRLHIIVPC